jgi:hypothetical protein
MMLGKTNNPTLQKVEAGIQAKVPPKLQRSFTNIVKAGETVMYSKQSHHLMMDELKKPGDLAMNIGHGIAGLMALLYKESERTLDSGAIMLAAQVLACEAMDFAEKSGVMKVDDATVSQVIKETISGVLQAFGMTPDKLSQMAQQSKQKAAAPAGGGLVANAMGG